MKDNKKLTKTYILLAILIVLIIAGFIFTNSNNQKRNQKTSQTGFYFDTVITITIYGKDEKTCNQLILDCFDKANYYENLFSRTKEGSDIYRINKSNGKSTVVDPSPFELISEALKYAKLSNGLVDPTIGSVSSLWDFHSDNPVVPDDDQIKEAINHVDYKKVVLDNSNYSVTLEDPKAMLDLGFIAKGYIADKFKSYLKESGIESAIINLGGNVVTIGNKPDGTPFQIGIQDPFSSTGTPYTTVDASDLSIVSSGSYERYFEYNGQKYHHILDTKTGYPVNSGLAGISVISESSLQGDALSTYLFILGEENAREYAESNEDISIITIPVK